MSQTTDDSPSLIHIATPLVQVSGGQSFQLDIETTARQVRTADGLDVETRLNTIERAVAGNSTVRFAETIEERDSLTGLIPGDMVVVHDATADETVDAGGARYIYLPDGAGFRKVSEDESMDVVCDWSHVENRPTSSVTDIDLAVARQHTHSNIETLSHLSDDGADNLLYKGKRINDGKVWICRVASLADIPTNLADNGLVFLTAASQESGGGDE